MENLDVMYANDFISKLLEFIDNSPKRRFLKGVLGKPIKIRVLNNNKDYRVIEDFSISYKIEKRYFHNRHYNSSPDPKKKSKEYEVYLREPVFNFAVDEVILDDVKYLALRRRSTKSETDILIPAEGLKIQVKSTWVGKRYFLTVIPTNSPIYEKTGLNRYHDRPKEGNTSNQSSLEEI